MFPFLKSPSVVRSTLGNALGNGATPSARLNALQCGIAPHFVAISALKFNRLIEWVEEADFGEQTSTVLNARVGAGGDAPRRWPTPAAILLADANRVA